MLPLCLLLLACSQEKSRSATRTNDRPCLMVLGVAQDAGYPQAGCHKACCAIPLEDPQQAKLPVSLALIDPEANLWWLLEATPAFPAQLERVHQAFPGLPALPAGIFLTHAHMGHYTGLMHLGREVMGASKVPVYAMPRMRKFLTENGPWSQLVGLENISLQPLSADSTMVLSRAFSITPFLVPHRDEFSETAGFRVKGAEKSLLFIPDIDKWEKWDKNLKSEISKVDLAFLDGTFFENGELPGRDMSEIPHPFVSETMKILENEAPESKAKIRFIHFNHTNPLNFPDQKARDKVREKGFEIAVEGEITDL